MPEVRADLYLRVDAFSEDAEHNLHVQVQNQVADPDGLRVNANVDGTAGAMAVPTTLTPQKVEMRVYVDNTLVPELHGCRVTRSRKNNLQSWEFTVPIHRTATGYAGAWEGGGVGLCKQAVDIYGVYQTTTGTHEVPLIVNGIADTETRESNGGALVTYSGVDAGGRYDGEEIDFILPPGSGLPRERVIKIAATRAGVEDISLETSGATMMKEFQLADAQFIQPCQEIADVEGRVIQWDRDGFLVWPQYGSYDLVPSTSRWSLNEKHWVAGTGRLTQPGELLTEVTVEGDEQVLVGACGDVTSTVTITTKSLNGPISPAYAQSGGSSYAANPQPTALTTPITVKVETFETTRRCGILVYEKRTLRQFFNPEVSRYEWNAAGDSWDTLAGVYTDDNTDDDSPAYAYERERWTLTEVDETFHYWFRENYEGDDGFFLASMLLGVTSFGADLGWGLRAPKGWDGLTDGTDFVPANDPGNSYSRDWEGLKIGTLSHSFRWFPVRQYVKQRAVTAYPFPIWEEVEPANSWDVFGSKESVVGGSEAFALQSSEINILGADSKGYQTDDDVYRLGYMALSGSPYLYGDDTERGDDVEEMRYIGSTLTKYIGSGEQSHDEYVTETDHNDRTTSTVGTTGLDSYLPSAERIPDSGPTQDTDVYTDDTEETELYTRAYRTETKPISVTVTDDDLENCARRGVHKVQSAYLENEDEADWLARWLIDEGMAAKFDGELAGANFFIEPGDWCAQVRYRQIGVDGAGRVEEVSWDWRPGAPLNTKVQIILYEVTP